MIEDFKSRVKVFAATHDQNALGIAKEIAQLIFETLEAGCTVFTAGNGGSASEASHLAAELIGRFLPGSRKALRSISLNADTSVLTAIGNDFGFENLFSRQIEGMGRSGDLTICLSTSGRSPNIIKLVESCQEKGIKTIFLTGSIPETDAPKSEILFRVKSNSTALVQEVHLSMIHLICALLEELYRTGEIPLEVSQLTHLAELEGRDEVELGLVWVNGCFDVLHKGHISFLRQASALGNKLCIGLNSDKSIRDLKGMNRPIQGQTLRAETLLLLPWVDKVVIFDDVNPADAISKVKPQIIAKSMEYKGMEIPEDSVITRLGIRVEYIDKIPGISTSNLIKAITSL